MTIVEQIVREDDLDKKQIDYRRSLITLPLEDRQKTHSRRCSDDGIEFAISLEPGITLTDGDCFILESEHVVVMIREAAEAVYVVRPRSSHEWAYLAYQIGNRHQKLMISDNELICLRDPAVLSLFDQLKTEFEEDKRPFTPTNVASGVHKH